MAPPMPRPSAVRAERRAEVDRLQRLFESLERTEPSLIAVAKGLLEKRLTEAMPRLRAYAIETGAHQVTVDFCLSIDFTPGAAGVKLATKIVPPTYEAADAAHVRG